MSARPPAARFARFGIFEADLQERVLHRNGLKVSLQNQPFEVLAALLERPGETVTSEELSRRVWPDGTYLEFEHSLSTAVLKIRRVLGDSADNPRFIETIPRHGYRFIAPVQVVSESRFAAAGTPRALRKLYWAIPPVAIAALAMAAVAYLMPRGTARAELPTPAPLTTTPGWEHSPSFSPDGTRIAYTWCEEGAWEIRGNCDIFVKFVGSEPSLSLTDFPWVDASPAWSPDGRLIAFLRIPPEGMATYHVVPATSGRERKLAETFPPTSPALFGAATSWFPDGVHLAVVVRDSPDGPHSLAVLSLETGARRALTDPAPNGLGDTALAVSPDGRRLAFARTGLARTPFSDIYVAGVSGDFSVKDAPRRLVAKQPAPVSLTWMPDGDAIIFSSGGSLWRMSVTGGETRAPDRVTFAGAQAADPALSRDGRRLAYSQRQVRQNIWRVELAGGSEAAGAPRALMPSTREDGWPQYSPDGRQVAFVSNRSGSRQIYICDAGGSNLVRLTSLAGGVERPYPGWSPNAREIVFAATVAGNTDLFVADVQGGPPRRLTFEPSTEYHPQWSRDGKWVYFASDRTGERQIWKMPGGGGEAVQMTEHGGEGPFESPDGRHLFYVKAGAGGAEQLWRRLLSGGGEHQVLPEVFRGNFAMMGERVYFIPQRDAGCDCYHLQRLDLATGKTSPVMDVRDVGGGLSVSSDGRSLLYTTVVHTSADLILVEGFR
jgi:Tol biopolymer transport system component/DNA-binding winged helix-turn-helix (wHTH) protein